MSTSLQSIRRRVRTVAAFAGTGLGWSDRVRLGLAGLARHRPFGGTSLYTRVGRLLARTSPPHVTAAGGQRIALDLTRADEVMIFEEIFVDHTYPLEKIPFIPDTVVDCGAYAGMFTLLARARFPAARFQAFEPEPRNVARTRANFSLNGAPVELIPAAVGVRDGVIHFSGSGFGGHITANGGTDGIEVPLVSLARHLRELRPERLLLKLDVEGAEREILPDILPILPEDTTIFLETHHPEEECHRYLQPFLAAGFEHELVRNRHALGEPTQYLERVLIRHRRVVRHFCTYFDSHYAAMGLALYHSLRRVSPHMKLWVLCFDEASRLLLERLALPDLAIIPLAELEADDGALRAVRPTRDRIAYYFTCTPCLPLHLFRRHPEIELLTYVDADLGFFGNPEHVFSEMGSASIGIIPHGFSAHNRHLTESGNFNVGLIGFRRDAQALACLEWWRQRCLEWCHLRHEDGRYADQKYLDEWPARFPGVKILRQPGANLAMWNVARFNLTVDGDVVRVDGMPLVFFHFHGLRRPAPHLFELSAAYYGVRPGRVLLWKIFAPYLRLLTRLEAEHGLYTRPGGDAPYSEDPPRTWYAKLRWQAGNLAGIARRRFLACVGGRIIGIPW
ncbi:MAG TPA: FkbM family methyltransferase [Lacunisphaera sp.]|nr:FkbM family methyltransferase [Lacunisphaera sp.]